MKKNTATKYSDKKIRVAKRVWDTILELRHHKFTNVLFISNSEISVEWVEYQTKVNKCLVCITNEDM